MWIIEIKCPHHYNSHFLTSIGNIGNISHITKVI